MEEIIQILIFIGAMAIAVITQSAKNKKKPMTASPQETLEDMFPEIEVQGDEQVMPPSEQPVVIRKKPLAKKKPTLQPNPPVQHKEAPKQEKKIKLNSREKARQAFIHSEIFNRKY